MTVDLPTIFVAPQKSEVLQKTQNDALTQAPCQHEGNLNWSQTPLTPTITRKP